MSRQKVRAVRQPITLRARSRRSLEERIYLRFRSVMALVTRVLWRLPPRSRPRRAFLVRTSQISFDAINRGDFAVTFLLYHPDVEFTTPPTLVGLGFDPVYRGREARFQFQRRWTAEWGEMRFEPEEIIDLGDRVLYVGHFKGSGLSSGAGFESGWGNLVTISGGQVVHEQPFFDVREAREAAGLPEDRAG